MDAEKLKEMLELHKQWLKDKSKGRCADLQGADLQNANLRNADLRFADLRNAYLGGASLRFADLQGADLQNASLRFADLRNAYLSGANLQGTNLQGADLRNVSLQGADLAGADIDFSCLPLWCGSIMAQFDDRQLRQIAYHLVKSGLNSKNASAAAKAELAKLIDFANQFHRVHECGEIKIEKGE